MSGETGDRIKHASLHDAMIAIADTLKKGIRKTRRNVEQNYDFRGVEDILNHVAPVMAKHGVCLSAEYGNPEIREFTTKRGGIGYHIWLPGEFVFVHGTETRMVRTIGEAMDYADKATNKCMSAALKYALITAFCIPVEGLEDSDAESPETGDRPQQISVDEVCQRLDAAKDKDAFKAAWKDAAAQFTAAKDTFGYNAAKEYMLQAYEDKGFSA